VKNVEFIGMEFIMINRRMFLGLVPVGLAGFSRIWPNLAGSKIEYVDVFVESIVDQTRLNNLNTHTSRLQFMKVLDPVLNRFYAIRLSSDTDIILNECSEVFKMENPTVKHFYVYNFWYRGRIANQLATTEKLIPVDKVPAHDEITIRYL
jgi:hypothetical protein